MTTIINDLRHGVRLLRRAPGFSTVAIATLALGIGASTAMFSVINAVLLRPFPYPEADSILRIRRGTSPPDLWDLIDRSRSFSGFAGYRSQFFDYANAAEAERLDGVLATAGTLELFGATTVAGRLLSAEDDRLGAPLVTLVSERFWRARLASDPNVVGRLLQLSGKPYAVVGVLGAGFDLPATSADIYAAFMPAAGREATARGAHTLRAFARLEPGVTARAAQQELDVIGSQLRQQYPASNTDVSFVLQELRTSVSGDAREPLFILLSAVGLVLLIACVNVANLLIARTASRRTELAVRVAVGATRARIVRQLATESLVLVGAGGALGCALAWWITRAVAGLAPEGIPGLESAVVDGPVLLFAAAVSLLTGLVFGAVPAIRFASASVAGAARAGRATRTGHRLRSLLLVAEVALALVLVVGAGLLTRSFVSLISQTPGFDTSRLVTGNVTLNASRYGDVPVRAQFWHQFEERVRALPGVRDVAITTELPIGGSSVFHNLTMEDRPVAPGTEPEVYYRGVNESYFRAMGIPLLKGRPFSRADRAGAPLVAVVNEAFVRTYFGGGDVLGRRVRWASGDGTWITIVGVVADVRGLSLDLDEVPAMHMPHAQEANPWRRWMDVAVRSDLPVSQIGPALRTELRALDPNVPVVRIRTMDDVIAASVADRRFNLLLLGSFAVVALVLAAAGTYGVMAYLVAERTREIGVRLALGASPADVFGLVVGRGMALSGVGVVIGLAAATGLSRVLQAMLFNVDRLDLTTFSVAATVLLAAAAAASAIPARRAARIDPLIALRSE